MTWATAYPKGSEFTKEAVKRVPGTGWLTDHRLMERYQCEYGLFRVVEAANTAPLIKSGFATVDEFLALAQTVANRRRSRAGRSLERHLATVFDEEAVAYDWNKPTEGKRRPDFLFPGTIAYHAGRPTTMLGVKTTVKDRWRQVLSEAARIPRKHLFTLSEGVSLDQFQEMTDEHLQLVVPKTNIRKFPVPIRPKLMTLDDFVRLVK